MNETNSGSCNDWYYSKYENLIKPLTETGKVILYLHDHFTTKWLSGNLDEHDFSKEKQDPSRTNTVWCLFCTPNMAVLLILTKTLRYVQLPCTSAPTQLQNYLFTTQNMPQICLYVNGYLL